MTFANCTSIVLPALLSVTNAAPAITSRLVSHFLGNEIVALGFRASICTVLLAMSSAQAQAEFFFNDYGLSNPLQTVTFDEHVFDPGTTITDQFSDVGVTFSGWPLTYDTRDLSYLPNFDGPTLSNFYGQGSSLSPDNSEFSIRFIQPQTAAAFALVTAGSLEVVQGYLTSFTALLDGEEIETALHQTSNDDADNFFGFSGVLFDEIRVNVYQGVQPSSGGNSNNAGIDSIQVSSVPEPSTIVMWSIIASICGFVLRRQSKREMRDKKDVIQTTESFQVAVDSH